MASAPRPGERGKTKQLALAAAVTGVLVLAVLAAAGFAAWTKPTVNGMPAYTPSCSWSLRVRGDATSAQAGLIRCYLRALAHHDAAGLRAVAFNDTNRPVRITAKDFRHAADARSGVATATRGPEGEDNAYAVTIVFADHAKETVAMAPVNPAVLNSWRLGIGTPVTQTGPPPGQP